MLDELIFISKMEYMLIKQKADKWDKLEKEIGRYYPDEETNIVELDGDLGNIGEAAAKAFGYL